MSINDWAAKAASRIVDEYAGRRLPRTDEDHVAAIIATFAEPLVRLVRDSRGEHHHCDDSWYCCGKCTSLDHVMCPGGEDHEHDAACYLGSHGGEAARISGVCNCGADAWNARIDAMLAGPIEVDGSTLLPRYRFTNTGTENSFFEANGTRYTLPPRGFIDLQVGTGDCRVGPSIVLERL